MESIVVLFLSVATHGHLEQLQKKKKNNPNSLAKDFAIFAKLAKIPPRRAYMRPPHPRASTKCR
jgi:hypothetical protein